MHGTLNGPLRGRQLRRRRHLRRHGDAIKRAFRAAQELIDDYQAFLTAQALIGDWVQRPTNRCAAAELFGSNLPYVSAASTLLQAENLDLIDQVFNEKIPLLEAAKRVRKRAELVRAYRKASPAGRVAFGKIVGVDHVFDETIAPSL